MISGSVFRIVPDDTDDTVSFLEGLAGLGPVLELGIGTGRVALPLAEKGVEVHGIDTSEAIGKAAQGQAGRSKHLR
jgi:2-polyprenyl-3-methyl-5-hydroxy-6-metoxy-1,4-benzoquinol methylase